MTKRLISAVFGTAVVILVLAFNDMCPFILNASIAVICGLSVFEVFSAMDIYKAYYLVIPSIIFSVIMPLFGVNVIWQISLYLFTVIIFSIMIFNYKVFSFRDISATYSMTLIITLSLSTIVMIRNINGDSGVFYVTIALAMPWMTDVGAFFVGRGLGKKKLCPNISPNKTVEGAVGGVLTSVLSMVLISFMFQRWWFKVPVSVNYLYLIIMSVIGAFMAILGDLCFSFVKRSCHVKDFGNAFPGHGGFLDRFDSVILTAPFVYLFTMYIPIIA